MIAASIAILSSAAVVSTGFAAWVISGGNSEEVSGTIKADIVSDNYHTITLVSEKTAAIYFGAPKESTADITNPWLKNDSKEKESLLAEFTFTVANVKTGKDNPGDLFSSITLKAENDTAYNAAVTDELVSSLPASWKKETYDETPTYSSKTADKSKEYSGIYLVRDSGTASDEGASLTFKLYVQFTWGNAFEHKNPFFFYNAEGKTAANNGSDAKTKLGKVADIKDTKFTLTITAQ